MVEAIEKTSEAMGYEATRHRDGSMVIHGVPIFVACERGEIEFDQAWIEKAVEKAKSLAG